MTGYLISEAAERSGFAPSALRYYERIGLLPPPGRTESGYRVYDDEHVDRLRFIARAKRLGLRLEEIEELAGAWADEGCSTTLERLRAAVADKLALVEHEVAELSELRGQLRDLHRRLESDSPAAGSCGPTCGCAAALDDADGFADDPTADRRSLVS